MEDVELLIGLHRHLGAYATNATTSSLGEIQFAGKLYDLAFRIRGSGVSSLVRIEAIASDAGINAYEAKSSLLIALEELGWVRLSKDANGATYAVEEAVPPVSEILASTQKVLAMVSLSALGRAALAILKSTTLLPLERNSALQSAAEFGDEVAEAALRALEAINLVREVHADDGRTVVFNPNVWKNAAEVTNAALRVEDSRIKTEVGSLIEEVQASQGLPEDKVLSTEQRWIDFGVSQGLIQRSVVATNNGDERRFLFTPHLQNDAFGNVPNDSSGHVRQLVGSMVYAATYPAYKLTEPDTFIRSLLANGRAGNASPIGTDYPMLETAGIVRVVPGRGEGRYAFELLQADVAEASLKILENRPSAGRSPADNTARSISAQQRYRHLESERARLVMVPSTDDKDIRRLVAAVRQAATSRRVSDA